MVEIYLSFAGYTLYCMFPVFNYRDFFKISCLQILHFLKINGVIFVAFYLLNREIMYTKQLHSIIKFSAIAIILSLLFFQCSSSKKSTNQNTKLTAEDVRIWSIIRILFL